MKSGAYGAGIIRKLGSIYYEFLNQSHTRRATFMGISRTTLLAGKRRFVSRAISALTDDSHSSTSSTSTRIGIAGSEHLGEFPYKILIFTVLPSEILSRVPIVAFEGAQCEPCEALTDDFISLTSSTSTGVGVAGSEHRGEFAYKAVTFTILPS